MKSCIHLLYIQPWYTFLKQRCKAPRIHSVPLDPLVLTPDGIWQLLKLLHVWHWASVDH